MCVHPFVEPVFSRLLSFVISQVESVVWVIIVGDLIVVLILLALQITQISRRTISRGWRSGNIVCILLIFGRTRRQGFFRVLVETAELQNDDFVVEERSEGQEEEAGDAFPVEGFEAEQTGNDPDTKGATSVNSGSLSCRSHFGCSDSTHVEECDGDHN